ncbi:MAG TPA: hypothetical protein VG293_02950 [Solirubrobacteraceae bacterium]|jgi:hypothetical protein|nr:hypothetical protein [Solirubrobacteraceae bacterium]
MQAAGRFEVRFDELAFTDDLAHATPAGRDVAQAAKQRLERDGTDLSDFKRCDPNGRDGTRLPNCVKIHLPRPGDRWRMVFEITRDKTTGTLGLTYRAFGVGHPEHPWQPSAYQVAHGRLHPSDGPPHA